MNAEIVIEEMKKHLAEVILSFEEMQVRAFALKMYGKLMAAVPELVPALPIGNETNKN